MGSEIKIAPCFSHLIEAVLKDGKIGICGGNVRISDIKTG